VEGFGSTAKVSSW